MESFLRMSKGMLFHSFVPLAWKVRPLSVSLLQDGHTKLYLPQGLALECRSEFLVRSSVTQLGQAFSSLMRLNNEEAFSSLQYGITHVTHIRTQYMTLLTTSLPQLSGQSVQPVSRRSWVRLPLGAQKILFLIIST